jgi:hypothetical protein
MELGTWGDHGQQCMLIFESSVSEVPIVAQRRYPCSAQPWTEPSNSWPYCATAPCVPGSGLGNSAACGADITTTPISVPQQLKQVSTSAPVVHSGLTRVSQFECVLYSGPAVAQHNVVETRDEQHCRCIQTTYKYTVDLSMHCSASADCMLAAGIIDQTGPLDLSPGVQRANFQQADTHCRPHWHQPASLHAPRWK